MKGQARVVLSHDDDFTRICIGIGAQLRLDNRNWLEKVGHGGLFKLLHFKRYKYYTN